MNNYLEIKNKKYIFTHKKENKTNITQNTQPYDKLSSKRRRARAPNIYVL